MTNSSHHKPPLSRRRFIKCCLAASAFVCLPAFTAKRVSAKAKLQKWSWQGQAMGTDISIQLCHESQKDAKAITDLCIDEISRLESIFTLYSDNSELVRLNRNGALNHPSPELVELMSLAHKYGDITKGAFDVTSQPVWDVIKREGIDSPNIKAARSLVDYRNLDISPQRISFSNPGMAVSLNGIAQGYITDKIADLLASKNIDSALIDIGETRAIGRNENKAPWQVDLRNPEDNQGNHFKKVSLQNKALSTAGDHELSLSKNEENRYLSLSVIADTATMADALSTAFYLMPLEQITEMVGKMSDVSVIILHNDGSVQALG